VLGNVGAVAPVGDTGVPLLPWECRVYRRHLVPR
jgi:hypothetical protein